MRDAAATAGPRRPPRRLTLAAGLLVCAAVSWFLVPSGDTGAGYGVARLSIGVAVGGDPPESATAPAPAPGPQPAAAPSAQAVATGAAVVQAPSTAGTAGTRPKRRAAARKQRRRPAAGDRRAAFVPARSEPAAPIPEPATADPTGSPSGPSTGAPARGEPAAEESSTTSTPPTPSGGTTNPITGTDGASTTDQPGQACPPPPGGSAPADSTTTRVSRRPAAGVYSYLVQPAGAARPRATADEWVVSHDDEATTWDVTAPMGKGWSTTSTLRHTESAVELVAWRLVTSSGTTVVEPVRPVVDLALPAGPDVAWESTGYDFSRGVSIGVKGRYLDRQAVPLCGELVDAWRVQTTFIVEPLPLAPPGTPSFSVVGTRWVATQHGALLARAAQRVQGSHGAESLDLEATWYLRELTPR